jgi:hypothetical protein
VTVLCGGGVMGNDRFFVDSETQNIADEIFANILILLRVD